MPEVPKRAFAAPSSLQRSKFTLAPVSRRGGLAFWFVDLCVQHIFEKEREKEKGKKVGF